MGLTLHVNPTCDSPFELAPGPLFAGEPVGFFVRATAVGSAAVQAALSSNTPVVLAFTVVAGPPASVNVALPPELWVDVCSAPARLELQDAWGNAATPDAPLILNLENAASLQVSPAPNCEPQISALVVLPGEPGITFFVRPTARAQGTIDFVDSSSSVLSVEVPYTVRQRVTHGDCVIPPGQAQAGCAVPTGLFPNNTWLVFQALTRDLDPETSMVTCGLEGGAVDCEREQATNSVVEVHYVFVDLGPEARVLHLTSAGSVGPLLTFPLPMVDPSRAFVVASATSNNRNNAPDTEDTFQATLETNRVEVLAGGSGGNFERVDVQVVEHPSLRVRRGSAFLLPQQTVVQFSGLTPANNWLMHSMRLEQDPNRSCELGLLGEVVPEALVFNRHPQCPGGPAQVSWQVVEMVDHVRVVPLQVDLDANAAERFVEAPFLLRSRALGLMGGMRNGLAGGIHAQAGTERPGDMLAEVTPVAGGFRVRRETAFSQAKFGLTLLEFTR